MINMNPLDRMAFLANLDRYQNLLERLGAEPSIGQPNGASADLPHVFFVDSVDGETANSGNSPDTALASIDAAIGKCTANRGDLIVCLPAHVETVTAAAGLALDVAGVTIVGIGEGSLRAKINFTTAVGASMVVSAANCTMVNILFTGGIDALTNPVHIQAADFKLLGCETRDVTGQATDFIVTTDAADRLYISGWKHQGDAAAGADTAISIVGCDDIVIEDFDIYGNFAVAAIEQVTTAGNRHRYGGGAKQCYIWTENAADVAITLKSDTTGHIGPGINVMLQDNAANITECLVGAAAQFFLPLNVCNLAGELAMAINITASTDA